MRNDATHCKSAISIGVLAPKKKFDQFFNGFIAHCLRQSGVPINRHNFSTLRINVLDVTAELFTTLQAVVSPSPGEDAGCNARPLVSLVGVEDAWPSGMDCILHKLSDELAVEAASPSTAAVSSVSQEVPWPALTSLGRARRYVAANPGCLLYDGLDGPKLVTQRFETMAAVGEALGRLPPQVSVRWATPRTMLMEANAAIDATLDKQVRECLLDGMAGIVKTRSACSMKGSHQMAVFRASADDVAERDALLREAMRRVAVDADRLGFSAAVVLQRYIGCPVGRSVLKVYVAGKEMWLRAVDANPLLSHLARESGGGLQPADSAGKGVCSIDELRAPPPAAGSVVSFDSQNKQLLVPMDGAATAQLLRTVFGSEDTAREEVSRAAAAVASACRLKLFGFDVVAERAHDGALSLLVLDVNFFPGYKGVVADVHAAVLDDICNSVKMARLNDFAAEVAPL